jgi:hypothetical protein
MAQNKLSKQVDCIKDYNELDTGWLIKRWLPVDQAKIESWYSDLLENYGDWVWTYSKHKNMWKYDPNEELGKFMADDASWLMLTWGNDTKGPVPWMRAIAEDKFNPTMPHDSLGARECFTGYALEVVQNLPARARDIQVSIHTPGTNLPPHQDSPEKLRFHIPIETNEQATFTIDGKKVHIPADGWIYLVNTTYLHSTTNNGCNTRSHIYGGVMTEDILNLDLQNCETFL